MKVPFVDLYTQYLSIQKEIDLAIRECIQNAWFIGGKPVREFEEKFAAYIGVKHCIGCGNGTDAIELLLQAMDIGSGDEVIVPAMSWISTSEAVTTRGATPVFVDVHPDYYTIDASKIEEKITPKTKAIIPVHLYGLPAQMDSITAIARKHHLKILEDCAQAHGAAFKGQRVGTFGDAASFSFYPGKNLGAYGDAGCMITNNDDIAQKARLLTNHGQAKKHDHQIEGRNSRLDAVQAAILSVKLHYLDNWTSKRIAIAEQYKQLLNDSGIILPKTPTGSKHVYHLFVVQVDNRDEVMNRLSAMNIETAIHYPKALPFLKAYGSRNHKEKDFPVVAKMQERIVSLPMYAELDQHMIQFVSDSLIGILKGTRKPSFEKSV